MGTTRLDDALLRNQKEIRRLRYEADRLQINVDEVERLAGQSRLRTYFTPVLYLAASVAGPVTAIVRHAEESTIAVLTSLSLFLGVGTLALICERLTRRRDAPRSIVRDRNGIRSHEHRISELTDEQATLATQRSEAERVRAAAQTLAVRVINADWTGIPLPDDVREALEDAKPAPRT